MLSEMFQLGSFLCACAGERDLAISDGEEECSRHRELNKILGGEPRVVGSGADLPGRPGGSPYLAPLYFAAPLRLGSGPRHEYRQQLRNTLCVMYPNPAISSLRCYKA